MATAAIGCPSLYQILILDIGPITTQDKKKKNCPSKLPNGNVVITSSLLCSSASALNKKVTVAHITTQQVAIPSIIRSVLISD